MVTWRSCLIGTNMYFMVLGLILAAVAGWAKYSSFISSDNIAIGIITCGVLLILISIVGMMGTIRRNQMEGIPVLLLIYGISLLILFIIQVGVSAALLGVNEETQGSLLRSAWTTLSPASKNDLQVRLSCCGFDNEDRNDTVLGPAPGYDCNLGLYPPCYHKFVDLFDRGFKVTGGIGIGFGVQYLPVIVVALHWRRRILGLSGSRDELDSYWLRKRIRDLTVRKK